MVTSSVVTVVITTGYYLQGGAAAHLYDHCMKVWESVVNNPEEMIQKHSNGSFYTHAPIDMWEAINQHVSLATSTKSPVLHVMIAEKVVVSLQDLFNTIINYVQTLDTSNKPELRYALPWACVYTDSAGYCVVGVSCCAPLLSRSVTVVMECVS
jgi:hypothetical protein